MKKQYLLLQLLLIHGLSYTVKQETVARPPLFGITSTSVIQTADYPFSSPGDEMFIDLYIADAKDGAGGYQEGRTAHIGHGPVNPNRRYGIKGKYKSSGRTPQTGYDSRYLQADDWKKLQDGMYIFPYITYQGGFENQKGLLLNPQACKGVTSTVHIAIYDKDYTLIKDIVASTNTVKTANYSNGNIGYNFFNWQVTINGRYSYEFPYGTAVFIKKGTQSGNFEIITGTLYDKTITQPVQCDICPPPTKCPACPPLLSQQQQKERNLVESSTISAVKNSTTQTTPPVFDF